MPIILSPSAPNPTAPASATSSDGRVTVYADTDHAGVLLKADFSALSTKPVKVRFLRNGIRVRSGDPAWAPGGEAVAYDHEAKLGGSSSWTAVPIFLDGTVGAASAAASLTVPSMDDDVDCWVKPINDPGLSVAHPLRGEIVEVAWTARASSYAVPGSSLPVGTYDRRTPAPLVIDLRTDTHAEKDALNDALDVGPVLIQMRETYGIADFYAIPGDSRERYFVGMHDPRRNMGVTFTPIDRPPTVDSPLFIPGRSWAEQLAVAPTWADRLSAWPTWGNALGLP